MTFSFCSILGDMQLYNFAYSCTCNDGYVGDGRTCVSDSVSCDSDPCGGDNQVCITTDHGYTCECGDGYEPCGDACGDALSCIEVNECDSHPCGENQVCTNLPGPGNDHAPGYTCSCDDGYQENSGGKCEDIDECNGSDSPCGENQSCSNTIGSFVCECYFGFVENRDGVCEDVNECDDTPCDENQNCINHIGSFECRCNDGYEIETSGRMAMSPSQSFEILKISRNFRYFRELF